MWPPGNVDFSAHAFAMFSGRRVDAAATSPRTGGHRRPLPVLSAPDDLLVYECDGHTLDKALPSAVVFPSTAEQVAAIVKLANQYGVPFVARGAGTGLSGGALALDGGIVIEMCRMNKILEIDYVNQRQWSNRPVNLHLSLAVAEPRYYYAPTRPAGPAPLVAMWQKTPVGRIRSNMGSRRIMFLAWRWCCLTERLCTLAANPRHAWLRSHGLFVGSEGTFGIVTKVTVRLLRKPEPGKLCSRSSPQWLRPAMPSKRHYRDRLIPAAIEMMDNLTIQAVEAATGAGLPLDAGAVLLIELDGIIDGMKDLPASLRCATIRFVTTFVVARTKPNARAVVEGQAKPFGVGRAESPVTIPMTA